MKKKIALLLALVMTLSLVPMNVFGISLSPTTVPIVANSSWVTPTEAAGRSLIFDRNDFPETGGTYRAVISIVDGNGWGLSWLESFEQTVTAEGITITISDVETVLDYCEWCCGDYVDEEGPDAIITVVTTDGFQDPDESKAALPLHYHNEHWGWPPSNPDISVRFTEIEGGFFGSVSPILIARHQVINRSVSFSYDSSFVDIFSGGNHTLRGAIVIAEGSADVLSGTYTITLTLPSGFEWRTGTRDGISIAAAGAIGDLGFTVGTPTRNWGELRNDVNRRQLVLRVPITAGKVADALVIGTNNFSITALENARAGDVNVDVLIEGPRMGDNGRSGSVRVARLANEDVTFAVTDEEELIALEENPLISGQKFGWDVNTSAGAGTVGQVVLEDINDLMEFHATARVSLSETAPGTLILDGRSDITFTFGDGVQIIGAETRMWNNVTDSGQWANSRYFYIDGRESNRSIAQWNQRGARFNFDGLVRSNSFSLRPERGDLFRDRNTAHVDVIFFLSIEPGYVEKYGTNEISVTVDGRSLGGRTFTEVVAYVQDPIDIEADVTVIDEVADVSFGRVFAAPLSDVTVTEAISGVFELGDEIVLHIEGSRFGSTANDLTLRGLRAVVDNDSGMRISPIRRTADGRGVYVTVERRSDEEKYGSVTFEGLTVDGVVIPGRTYNLAMSGDAIAANFAIVNNNPRDSHGYYINEPYLREFFTYLGADLSGDLVPGETGEGLGNQQEQQQQQPEAARPPVVVLSGTPLLLSTGEIIFEPFYVRAESDGSGTGMMALAAVGELYGLTRGNGFEWDNASSTATFFYNGVSLVITAGNSVATVNGAPTTMVNSSGTAAVPEIRNNRLYVPFNIVRHSFNTGLTYVGAAEGGPGVILIP
jgi:hypothetical protein